MSKFLKIFAPAGAGAASVLTLAYVVADQFIVDMPAPIRGQLIQPAQAQETPQVAPAEAPLAQEIEVAALNAPEGGYGLGRVALADEVAAWDIDVRPDGLGLPAGSGDVWTGEEVFVEKCAACHGDFGEAVGRWPVLAGGQDTLTDEDPVKTIGSYWPYLSTVYDYVNRAMPFGEAQSLDPDEIYAITAYLLYVNDLVEDDFTLSNDNFLEVEMPNSGNFYMDDRAETELAMFVSTDLCMENCKDSVEITMHASVLDVTPETETEAEEQIEREREREREREIETEVVAEAAPVQEPAIVADEGPDPELIAAGEGVFRQCKSCHEIGDGARNKTGPHLNGIIGRTIGGIDGFRYSRVFDEAAVAGDAWTDENLAAFLTDPRGAMSGTKMSFRGVSDPEDLAALMAYLQSAGG